MVKLFKFLFFISLSTIGVCKLHAIEHYISFSSGISLNNSKFEQHILKSSLYKVGPKGKAHYLAQEDTISKIWNFKGNAPTFNVEYLANLNGLKSSREWLNIGIGLFTYNPKIKYSFKNSINHDKDVRVKLREYNIQPYAIILINAFNSKYFNLRLGTQLGLNYSKMKNHYSNILTNGKNLNQLTFIPQLVADSEIKFTNKISLFTRVNLGLINSIKDNIQYDNTLLTEKETNTKIPVKMPIGSNAPPRPHKLINTSVSSFLKYKNGSTYSFNIGIRYKI